MRGLFLLRWLTPAALAALLSFPVQTATAHPMGGMGGMGGHGMGGTHGHGMGSRPTTARTGSNRFAHQDPRSWNHDRFADRRDRFEDRREFFFRHNFFVAFDFVAFGFPWWGPWGPWWWYPDYAYYPYPADPRSSETQSSSGSQYGTQYWNDLAMSVQSKLAEQSYYRGPIDGVIGSGSLQAIRRFQSDHRLPVTGRIDPKLLKALGVEYKA